MSAAEKIMAELVEVPAGQSKAPDNPLRESLLADFTADPRLIDNAPPPRWIVRDRIPVCGANIAAPGATGKTTVALVEMVHIAAGLNLYGGDLEEQGPCALITAEDGANRYRYVLRRILEDGRNCGLSERAAAEARNGVKCVTWSRATFGPLCVLNPATSDMESTPAWSTLVDILANLNPRPVYVSLDPAVMFGAGERHGNDGDAFLAGMIHEAALHLGMCLQLVDHVSQNVARTGIVDQYAARGGTAKTDNARLARQLVRLSGREDSAVLPLVVTPDDMAQGRILQLHTTKLNYGPLPPVVWLRREGFWLEQLHEVSAEEVGVRKRAAAEVQRLADVRALAAAVAGARAGGAFPTQRTIEEAGVLTDTGDLMPRGRLRAALSKARADGELIDVELPAEQRRGKRQTYLETAQR